MGSSFTICRMGSDGQARGGYPRVAGKDYCRTGGIVVRVSIWVRVFSVLLVLSIVYLIECTTPPVTVRGVYAGIVLVVINGLFLLHARQLVKDGRGGERRP